MDEDKLKELKATRLNVKSRNRLIDMVKVHPVLYLNYGSAEENKNRPLREKLWEEIGAEFNLPGIVRPSACSVVRWKFKNMKGFYKRLYNKPDFRNGTRRCDIFDRLSFLQTVYPLEPGAPSPKLQPEIQTTAKRLSTRISAGKKRKLQIQSSDSDDNSTNDEGSEYANELCLRSSPLLVEAPMQIVNRDETSDREIETKQNRSTKNAKSKMQQKKMASAEGEATDAEPILIDELSLFFSCMKMATTKFGPHLQAKVKRIISEIMIDVEGEWLQIKSECTNDDNRSDVDTD